MKAVFLSYKYNDRTVLFLNFIAVGQTQVELKILKLKNCICVIPRFVNPVNFIIVRLINHRCHQICSIKWSKGKVLSLVL